MKEVPNPKTKSDLDIGCGLGTIYETGKDDPYYAECAGHDYRADDRINGTEIRPISIDESNKMFFKSLESREKELENLEGVRLDGMLRLRRYVYEGVVTLFTWLRIVK